MNNDIPCDGEGEQSMNTEQERAAFEAWANGRCELHLVNPAGRYSSATTQFAWEAYQAGRAALQSQMADAARDAERWREVERRARKHTAYDRYGDGAHWSVGVFSDDSRQTFGETIDAAMAKGGAA